MTNPVNAGADLLTIKEAVERGISRLRDPIWTNPDAYIKVDIFSGATGNTHGPRVRLFDELTQKAIGGPTPQEFIWWLFFRPGSETEIGQWQEFTGTPSALETR